MLAAAEMYVKGISTREVEAVMREFGIVCLHMNPRLAELLPWSWKPIGQPQVKAA